MQPPISLYPRATMADEMDGVSAEMHTRLCFVVVHPGHHKRVREHVLN